MSAADYKCAESVVFWIRSNANRSLQRATGIEHERVKNRLQQQHQKQQLDPIEPAKRLMRENERQKNAYRVNSLGLMG